jgi:hypothetical protein
MTVTAAGSQPQPCDQVAVAKLVMTIADPVRAHLRVDVPNRATVYEVLNALAIVTAMVLAGTENEARAFYDQALTNNLRQYAS